MASYTELFDLRTDSVLRNRIAVAVVIKAQLYVDGATPTLDELTWAAKALNPNNTLSEASKLLHYLIGANNSATIEQIQSVTDSSLQFQVSNAVDILVTGGVV